MLKKQNNKNISKIFNKTTLTHSMSAFSLFSNNNYKTKFFNNNDLLNNNFSKTQRKFSIYSYSKILKSPSENDNYKIINKIRKEEKKKQNIFINSYHKTNIRNKFKNIYQHFYITSLKDRYNDSLNSSLLSLKNNSTNLNHLGNNDNDSIELILNKDSFLDSNKGFKIQKRNFILGKIMNDYKIPRTLINYCKQIAVFKKIISDDKNRIIDIIDKRKNIKESLDNYYNRLKRNQKIFIKNFEIIYINYLKYLREIIENENIKLNKLKEKKKFLFTKVFNLNDLIKKENEKLIQLINIRDFLIKVKEKTLEIPPILKKMLNQETILENETKNIDKDILLRYKNYLNKSIPIFQNQEEFLYLFSSMENESIKLLLKLENNKDTIKELNIKLREINEDEERINQIILIQIKSKQNIRDDLYNHYKYYETQKSNLIQLLNNDNDMSNSYNNSKKAYYTFLNDNKYIISILKYKKILSNYKIQYSYFLIKLGEGIKIFLKNNLLNFEILNHIAKNKYDLEKFLSINNTENDNYDIIVSKCVKLLSLYEKVVDKLLQKNFLYSNNINYLDDLQMAYLKRKKFIKQKNAKEKRNLIEQKKNYEINKIMDKKNQIRFKRYKKNYSFYNIKLVEKISKSSDLKNKQIQNKTLSEINKDFFEY